jgi:hypothetical protein
MVTGKCAATNDTNGNPMTDDNRKQIDLIVQNNPNLRPPEEITIEDVQAAPFPDNRRVRVTVKLTPFREPPNLELGIFDQTGRHVASSTAIAVINVQTSYVLHLRGVDDPTGTYTVRVALSYEDQPPQAARDITLTLPAPESGTNAE